MPWSIFSDGGGAEVAVGWAEQLLAMIGAPKTPGNIQFVYDWEVSEGGGGKYNPLNQGDDPGKPWLTTTGSQYGGGAADYASWQAGLQGASDYLHMPAYSGVLNALKAGQPTQARSALFASPWAASHYGYGSNFSNSPVPGGQPVLPPAGGAGGGPGGGGSGGGGSSNPACLISLPNVGPSFLGIGGGCLFSKPQARGFVGAMFITASVPVGLVGLIVLAAMAFRSTGASKVTGRAAEVGGAAVALIPGAEPAGVAIASAGKLKSAKATKEGRERKAAKGKREGERAQRSQAAATRRAASDQRSQAAETRRAAAEQRAQERHDEAMYQKVNRETSRPSSRREPVDVPPY